MSDLEIPDAALNAYEEAGSYRHALKIAAPLIVAAELRRLADHIEHTVGEWVRRMGPSESDQGALDSASLLRDRADELDPQ